MRHTVAVVFLFAAFAQGQPQPQLVWEGEVDGIHLLHIRGNRLDVEDKQGTPVQRDRHQFFEQLPELRQDVQVQVVEGRGPVRILQQPGPENNYTLSVQIEDRAAGRAFYSLSFCWRNSSRAPLSFPAPSRSSSGSGRNRSTDSLEERLTWSGTVDDEVIVECRAKQCMPRQIRGGRVNRDQVSFTRPLPTRDVQVTLDGVEGRGEVQLLESPGQGNNFTAKVRVRDSQSGSDNYTFSLSWIRPPREEPEQASAKPGLTWQGRVDGRVRVTVNGRAVVAETLSGARVTEERHHFSHPLPSADVPNATARKSRGRGKVEIVEYPALTNGYRLVFEVSDSLSGADLYEVEVGW